MTDCEQCLYCEYDEEYGENVCTMNLDEDEYERTLNGKTKRCPYFRFGDDYTIVRKQN